MELALRLKLDSIEKKIDFILSNILPPDIELGEEEPKQELSKEEQLQFWNDMGVEK
jgi:hypothetical protein